jgi:hypothetical protein
MNFYLSRYDTLLHIYISLVKRRVRLFYLQALYGLYKLACWHARKKVPKSV